MGGTEMIEVWRPVTGFDGYEVSSLGRVKSVARKIERARCSFSRSGWPAEKSGGPLQIHECILRPGRDRGYLNVQLRKSGNTIARKVHKMVLEAFVGPQPKGQYPLAVDGNLQNVTLANLFYGKRPSKAKARVRRNHISLTTKLASALLALGDVTHEHAKQMTAEQIISLYQFDHFPVMYALSGPDEPWNLVPRLIVPHREKSKLDTTRVAKVRTLKKEHEDFRRRVLGVRKIKKPKKSRWPKLKMRGAK